MANKTILQILGKSHALEILSALGQKPMRFIELKEVCKSNRTRSARLRELENSGLIKTVAKMKGHRAYTFYEITSLGKEVLILCEKLLQLESK